LVMEEDGRELREEFRALLTYTQVEQKLR